MKKYFSIIATLTIFFILIGGVAALAAGAGGGGSSPPPAPAPAPESSPAPVPAPVCTEDAWNCGDFSACGMDGMQTRTCSFANDCAGVDIPKPEESQACTGLKCGHLGTLEERVNCRLQLSQEELAAEHQILYFPEYCKIEESEEEQQECITLYRKFNTCWQQPLGEKRIQCGQKQSGLKKSVKKEKSACLKKRGVKRRKCLEALNEKAERFTLFQMYEFSNQAENKLKSGEADLEAVANFDVFVEQTKREVEETESQKAWAKLLKKVQEKFNEFLGTL